MGQGACQKKQRYGFENLHFAPSPANHAYDRDSPAVRKIKLKPPSNRVKTWTTTVPDDRRPRRAFECRITQYDVPDSLLQGDPRHTVAKSRPIHSGGQVRSTQHLLVRPALVLRPA